MRKLKIIFVLINICVFNCSFVFDTSTEVKKLVRYIDKTYHVKNKEYHVVGIFDMFGENRYYVYFDEKIKYFKFIQGNISEEEAPSGKDELLLENYSKNQFNVVFDELKNNVCYDCPSANYYVVRKKLFAVKIITSKMVSNDYDSKVVHKMK